MRMRFPRNHIFAIVLDVLANQASVLVGCVLHNGVRRGMRLPRQSYPWGMRLPRQSYPGGCVFLGNRIRGGMRFPKGGCDSLGNRIRGDAFA